MTKFDQHNLIHRLSMNGKNSFVKEFLCAGRRQCSRSNGLSAVDEKDSLHHTLSFEGAPFRMPCLNTFLDAVVVCLGLFAAVHRNLSSST